MKKILLGTLASSLFIFVGCQFQPQLPSVKSTPTPTLPSCTPYPASFLPADKQKAGQENINIEMVSIPAGEFIMGSNTGKDNEKPEHKVDLDSYSISKYEVTQSQYKQFIDATGYIVYLYGEWDPVNKANYPVTYINWEDAKAFCEWSGTRLPTEAEWEKAARGTDGRIYPWGNNEPDCSLLNYGGAYYIGTPPLFKFDNNICNATGSTPVGTYPLGVSAYGVMDMAGNVSEWCNDLYDDYSYLINASNKNPQGAAFGCSHSVRGGSWGSGTDLKYYRCSNRSNGMSSSGIVGFRVAK